jgi:hypothetical protein
MSNTTIQILRSYSNTAPTVLDDGELAFSFVSNTLFIGSNTNQIISIGGPSFISNTINNTISVLDGGTF